MSLCNIDNRLQPSIMIWSKEIRDCSEM
ncbi:hypothetical protein IL54_4531 [Sphingobium sp. ba1]|nr:hypothetical protein IL54_4531 [Sphingobium sp. ba1]